MCRHMLEHKHEKNLLEGWVPCELESNGTCVQFGELQAEDLGVMGLDVQDLLHRVQIVNPQNPHAVSGGQVLSVWADLQGPDSGSAQVGLLPI